MVTTDSLASERYSSVERLPRTPTLASELIPRSRHRCTDYGRVEAGPAGNGGIEGACGVREDSLLSQSSSIPTNIFIIAFFLDPSRSQRDEDAVAWSWMYIGKSLLPKSCVTEHFHVGSIDPPQRKIKRE